MKTIKQMAYILYPFGVAIMLPLLLTNEAKAGRIRKMPISKDKPGVVILAFERTTALSFPVKPEKVVPGAPNKVQIEFLNKDVTVTPLARNPGNLHVYTKTDHYVILFQVGTEATYDDVVEISPSATSITRPLRLLDDSYKVVNFKIEFIPKQKGVQGTSSEVPASIFANERRIESVDLYETLKPYGPLRCNGCVSSASKENARLTCVNPIQTITCKSAAGLVRIERMKGS